MKTDPYIRKYQPDGKGSYFAIISGCRVTFTSDFELLSVTREYDVAGVKKLSTQRQIKVESTVDELQKDEIKKIQEIEGIANNNNEVYHEQYETIKTCLQCNLPVYLAGPAGSGKNYTVEQIAKELNWDFYFSNSVQQEFKLTGFIDAGGKFHETEFYKACKCDKDCIFFLDEMDASIPEVLVLLNAAIANGYFEFPTERINLEHVHFIAAGNTVGSGADEMYTGRMVLDQATLDRFAIIDFDYSPAIELSISQNNKELVDFIHQLREVAKINGIRATFSYRCITMVTKLEEAGMELEDIMKIAVVKGLDQDTINTLNIRNNTRYNEALKKIQVA